jgi:hypothetical protein
VTKYESDTIDRCDCDINRNFHNKPWLHPHHLGSTCPFPDIKGEPGPA